MEACGNAITALGMALLPFANIGRGTSLGIMNETVSLPNTASSVHGIPASLGMDATAIHHAAALPTTTTLMHDIVVSLGLDGTAASGSVGTASMNSYNIAITPTPTARASATPSEIVDSIPERITIETIHVASGDDGTTTPGFMPGEIGTASVNSHCDIITPTPTARAATPTPSEIVDSIPERITIETIRVATGTEDIATSTSPEGSEITSRDYPISSPCVWASGEPEVVTAVSSGASLAVPASSVVAQPGTRASS